jgi:hypothetical protein
VSLAARFVDNVCLAAYGPTDPTDGEWARYLSLVERGGVMGTVQLIHTEGGAPTSAQRRQLVELLGGRSVPVAVLSHSARVRLTVTALSWFNRGIRAFPPPSLLDALAYLEIPARRAGVIGGELAQLRLAVAVDARRERRAGQGERP